MNDELFELQEKLEEMCDHLDIDPHEYTVVRQTELEKLYEAYDKLEALECYGVDNWEWYGEAMQSLYNDEEDC